ncbi:MAG: hypothetical protein MJY63_01395 [Paludibacteraceae bacterium]|nr:hypothetical protein [Paludibacteraceae bacterium]
MLMNKNLFFGVASGIMLSALTFMTSCDDEDFPKRKPLKVLESVVLKYHDSSFTVHISLNYDYIGRIVRKKASYSNSDSILTVLTYEDKTILGQQISNNGVLDFSGEYTLQGNVSKYQYGDNKKFIYEYNDLGELISYTWEINNYSDPAINGKMVETYKWKDGNVVEIQRSDSKSVFIFSKEEKYKNFGKLRFDYLNALPDAAYGVANEYLPISVIEISDDGKSDTTNFIYTFDADGYPLTLTMNDGTHNFTWKDTGR